MYVDPEKKFDLRTLERNLRDGVITEEEYREFLESLPDVSDNIDEGEEEVE